MTARKLLLALAAITAVINISECQDCNVATFGADSFVCACSGSECDFPGDIPPPTDGSTFTVVTSARDGGRFQVDTYPTATTPLTGASIVIDASTRLQTMLGFGAAFTDASGLNIMSLSNATQDTLMRSYFAPEGIRYDLCRTPIAGSDFSTRPYSYDDVEGDVDLEFFALQMEDYQYKLPLIRRAIELTGPERELKMFASPWAPPAWMKTNGMFNGSGTLLTEMWQPYANYFVKFLDAYAAEGVPMWGVTTQNEPMTGFEDWYWNTCGWTAEDTRDWVAAHLGPTLDQAGYQDLQIMVVDHNRDLLPFYPATILDDAVAYTYVDGIAIHWYADDFAPPELLSEVHDLYPEKFLLYTESCEGWDAPADSRVVLGDWERAQSYADNIIDDVTHYSTGWVDWNMALDMTGGPNWANNFVDSPIIIDASTDTFYKQPMFYAMGHFSKFILPGAEAVPLTSSGSNQDLKQAAFVNPDGVGVLVLLNTGETAVDVSLQPSSTAQDYLNVAVPAKSIQTWLFNLP